MATTVLRGERNLADRLPRRFADGPNRVDTPRLAGIRAGSEFQRPGRARRRWRHGQLGVLEHDLAPRHRRVLAEHQHLMPYGPSTLRRKRHVTRADGSQLNGKHEDFAATALGQSAKSADFVEYATRLRYAGSSVAEIVTVGEDGPISLARENQLFVVGHVHVSRVNAFGVGPQVLGVSLQVECFARRDGLGGAPHRVHHLQSQVDFRRTGLGRRRRFRGNDKLRDRPGLQERRFRRHVGAGAAERDGHRVGPGRRREQRPIFQSFEAQSTVPCCAEGR